MRLSEYPIQSLKEVPAEAEIVSHRLMLSAGLIRRLAGGLYTWLPMGLRVLRKVERVIREEMNRAGALEISMPVVQPAELWVESGRWDQFGPELLRFKDRHERDMVLGPTHEEVVTDLARRELKSYRQLPVNFYQIQTKFRDEIRPRFGVMRAREFVMKDAYSFHADEASLAEGYRKMYDAYSAIFTRLGLRFRAVHADTGAIGGSASQEFHVLADSGEDAIVFSDGDDYAANLELAEALPPREPRPAPAEAMREVATPHARTIADVAKLLKLPASRLLKTLVVEGADGGLVALLLRGDHELNALKAGKLPAVAKPLRMAEAGAHRRRLRQRAGVPRPGRARDDRDRRPRGRRARRLRLRREQGRRAPRRRQLGPRPAGARGRGPAQRRRRRPRARTGPGTLSIARGIEVGHIFQLGLQVQRGHEGQRAGRPGPRRRDAHGLLRHRRHAHRGRGHRAEPRRARHRLARAARAVRRRRWSASTGKSPPPCATPPSPFTASSATPASRSCSTTATRGRASSSRTPSCSASRTGSSSRIADSPPGGSSTGTGAPRRTRTFRRAKRPPSCAGAPRPDDAGPGRDRSASWLRRSSRLRWPRLRGPIARKTRACAR